MNALSILTGVIAIIGICLWAWHAGMLDRGAEQPGEFDYCDVATSEPMPLETDSMRGTL